MVILDDGAAREWATVAGLPLTGTVGLLVESKHRGFVPAVAPLLAGLQALGFRLHPSLVIAVLTDLGEL